MGKTVKLATPVDVRFILSPRTSTKAKERQRDLTRDIVAFSADPYHRGTKNPQQLFKLLSDAYFNLQYQEFNPSTNKWTSKKMPSAKESLIARQVNELYRKAVFGLKGTIRYNDIDGFENALYGKNYTQNRKFTQSEMQERLSKVDNWDVKERNTVLPQMAELFKDVDIEVSVFDRVNHDSMKKAYDAYNEYVTNPKYTKLKLAMVRTYLQTPLTKFINVVTKNGLWQSHKTEEFIDRVTDVNHEHHKEA